jgi:hypothetical protein
MTLSGDGDRGRIIPPPRRPPPTPDCPDTRRGLPLNLSFRRVTPVPQCASPLDLLDNRRFRAIMSKQGAPLFGPLFLVARRGVYLQSYLSKPTKKAGKHGKDQ